MIVNYKHLNSYYLDLSPTGRWRLIDKGYGVVLSVEFDCLKVGYTYSYFGALPKTQECTVFLDENDFCYEIMHDIQECGVCP